MRPYKIKLIQLMSDGSLIILNKTLINNEQILISEKDMKFYFYEKKIKTKNNKYFININNNYKNKFFNY